jgi:hypothetical protein
MFLILGEVNIFCYYAGHFSLSEAYAKRFGICLQSCCNQMSPSCDQHYRFVSARLHFKCMFEDRLL